jgi:hypothetical protein
VTAVRRAATAARVERGTLPPIRARLARLSTAAVLSTVAFVALLVLAAPAAHAHGLVPGYGQRYLLDDDRDGVAEHAFVYGRQDDEVLFGDWDGDGVDSPAVRRGATFYFRQSSSSGPADTVVTYGRPDDGVLAGDWDGDGTDTLAVRRGNVYYLSDALLGGVADVVTFGRAGDAAFAGDWDGDGRDTLALRRENRLYLSNTVSGGAAEHAFAYGRPWDVVLVGDWDGDGRDTVGVRRANLVHVRNSTSSGPADATFAYGRASDTAAAGDWDGDGTDTVGVRRPPEHPDWLTGSVTDISGVVPYSGTYDPRNGRLAPSQLCLIPFMPSHYIHCRARADLVAFHQAYQARFGERLPVDTWDRSTYRSLEEQERTWVEIGPPIAARPGTSPHGWGLAVDMFEGPEFAFGSTRYRWLLENGPRFGWANLPWHQETGSVPEYWHFDYVR